VITQRLCRFVMASRAENAIVIANTTECLCYGKFVCYERHLWTIVDVHDGDFHVNTWTLLK